MTGNDFKRFFLIAVLIFSYSCQDLEKMEKPANLIPEAEMIDILTELSLVHAARNYNKSKLEKTGIKPDQYIFDKFGIDSLQFQQSSDYYAEQYSQYDRIYDSVKARVQIMKIRLDSLREIEVRIEDSLRTARQDSLKTLDSIKKAGGDSLYMKREASKKKLRKVNENIQDCLIAPPSVKRLKKRDTIL
ncbi:DUF4296 domain-containing protein [Christiangramia salexigens]|uniref:DUF4296 domain-containing protein n=1 Tax=Christiangramia salexigens TaxID=1913577 RepID=A0A1L3J5Q1_9FLAO|nr:DUF4296 domain-containing protein [Christiangramia salexigens]APG60465.1 hypothetical protein LPB144_08645 [Christiangramia salexigens]